MKMTEIYLIRHGESTMNKENRYYGWLDAPLTELGKEQLKGLKDFMEKQNIEYVISSPLSRALNSASLSTGREEVDIIIEERIKEMNFGIWEGLDIKELQTQHKELWNMWCNEWKKTRIPDGESFEDFYNRVANFIREAIKKYKGKRICIVSHQGVLRIILSYLIGLNEEGFWHFSFTQGRYSKIILDENNYCIIKNINSMA